LAPTWSKARNRHAQADGRLCKLIGLGGAQAALLRALAAVLGELETVPDAALAAAVAAAGRLAGDYPILHPSGQRPDANAALAALLHALAPRPALLAAAAPRLAAAVLEHTLRAPETLAAPAAARSPAAFPCAEVQPPQMHLSHAAVRGMLCMAS
jgi:hypothetical protein